MLLLIYIVQDLDDRQMSDRNSTNNLKSSISIWLER